MGKKVKGQKGKRVKGQKSKEKSKFFIDLEEKQC